MTRSVKTALTACTAAAALFAVPAGAHADRLLVYLNGGEPVQLLNSPSLTCPYSTQNGSTYIGETVEIHQGPTTGTVVGVGTRPLLDPNPDGAELEVWCDR